MSGFRGFLNEVKKLFRPKNCDSKSFSNNEIVLTCWVFEEKKFTIFTFFSICCFYHFNSLLIPFIYVNDLLQPNRQISRGINHRFECKKFLKPSNASPHSFRFYSEARNSPYYFLRKFIHDVRWAFFRSSSSLNSCGAWELQRSFSRLGFLPQLFFL